MINGALKSVANFFGMGIAFAVVFLLVVGLVVQMEINKRFRREHK